MLVIIIRTLILYTTVVFSLRLMGKRQIGELQPSERVVAIMISDVATVPMQSLDIPLLSGIIPVLTLVFAEVVTSYMSIKSSGMRRFFMGEPSIVVYNGIICEKELMKQRFNLSDLLEELRVQGCFDISDVFVAVLETNGKLSVIPRDNARPATVEDLNLKNVRHEGLPCTVILDGKLNPCELKRSGKTEKQLLDELKKRGAKSVSEVFIASIDAEGEMFMQLKESAGNRK